MPAILIPILTAFASSLVARLLLLTAFASSLVARLLLGAGLAFVSYTFINDLVAQAQTAVGGLLNNLPADIIGILGILKIPQAISVIMSAIGIAAFIKSAKVFLGKA